MLLAPSQPQLETTVAAGLQAEKRQAKIKRSNTFSDIRTVWRRRSRKSQLPSVDEQAKPSQGCCQHEQNMEDKKRFVVQGISTTAHIEATIEPGSPEKSPQYNDEECVPTMNALKGKAHHANGDSKWLENISNRFSEKTKSSNGGGLFGSLRGKGSKEKKRQSLFSGGDCPRSPILVSHLRQCCDTDHSQGDQEKPEQRQDRPQRSPTEHTDSMKLATEHLNVPGTPEFGSLTDLSSSPPKPEAKSLATVRKSNSLPRSVLCSPVTSRKSKRPFGSNLTGKDSSVDRSPSPTSSLRSSKISSTETLHKPTAKGSANEPWQPQADINQKVSLTRSSSLPFDTDILLSSSHGATRKEGPTRAVAIGNGTGGGKKATRSHSFNTHLHSSVQRTHSHELAVLRERIVSFILETEQSYIQSLNTLIEDYGDMLVSISDNSSVKEVFLILPQLVMLHTQLAKNLEDRVSNWSGQQTIGDTLTEIFSQNQLTILYSSYIKYYSQARSAIDLLKQSRPTLAKEIEEKSRDNHGSYGKLSLEDLLIKPVQRIPRYLLFVKDLIKNTTSDHHDYYHLQQALEDLSLLARRVDESEGESKKLQQKKDLLNIVEGLNECLSRNSTLLRCETVTEIRGSTQRKDRLLILFSDVLVCAASRRRSSGFKRGSLMNINSLHTDMMKLYRIKWTSTLSSLSVTRSQAPETDRKRYNTLERELHHSQKDEDLLLQLMHLSSSLHTPHHELDQLLQDMLSKVRGGMSSRRQEMDSLPHDSARLDLLSHDCSPSAKYLLLFNSHSSRLDWEKSLRRAQLINTPHNALLPTNTEETTRHRSVERVRSGSSSMAQYIGHITMPSCRVGSQLSSAVSARSNKQLYVCVNDASGRGSIAILNRPSGGGQPQLVATLPLSSSQLLCASCVQHPLSSDGGGDMELPVDEPDCRSACSSPSDSWTYTGADPVFPPPSPPSSAMETRFLQNDVPNLQDIYHRSSSAPPNAFQAIIRHATPTSLMIAPTISSTDISRTERQSPLRNKEEWLWVGSEGGVIHTMKVMPWSLDIASSMTYEVGSPVMAIVQHGGWVWAGLKDGRLVIFNISKGSVNVELIAPLSHLPLQTMVAVGSSLLVASGNTVYSVNLEADTMSIVKKEVLTVPDTISHMVGGCGCKIYICVQSSMTVRGCVQKEGHWEVVTTVDCASTMMTSLKNYSSIVRQHKLSSPHIVSVVATSTAIVIGTSAGVMMALSTVHSPSTTPVPRAFPRGHVDSVQILLHIPSDKKDIILSGGHGLEELALAQVCDDVSETEGCLSFWSISKYLRSHDK